MIGEDGRITDEAPERFRGMTVEEARAAVVAELREQGLIARTEPYTHEVPFSQRSGERIEPLISLQWFMRMDELAPPAIEVVRSGQVRFWPENYTRVYMNWMENIRPWVISRQLWWGHRIPVWYRGDEIYVGTSEPEGEGWERDPDVLDTWFSSGLFPFAALGWPEDTPALRAFYPTDVLVTGRDIVFLWVARMIMLGIEFTRPDPVLRRLRPLDHPGPRRAADVEVARHRGRPARPDRGRSAAAGVRRSSPPTRRLPALRGRRCALGAATRCPRPRTSASARSRLAQGQQLTNKLWNAARLILLGVSAEVRAAPTPTAVEDRWILSRLERARAEIDRRIEHYDFAHAALGLYDFVYGELCDWYLELVKPRLRAGESELGATLLYVLTQTLAIAHPMIPFVTEEIYRYVPGASGLLAAGLPTAPTAPVDERAEASVGRVIEAVQAMRGWRDFAGVKAAATVPARLAAEGYEETEEHLARLARLSFTADGAEPVASVPVPGGAIEILPSDDVDVEGAQRRLAARRAKLEEEIERAERKLANQGFVDKAPPDVVQAERDKLKRLKDELDVTVEPRGEPSATSSPRELFGMRFGLDRMRRLMTALGNPQLRFQSIHVVGTNGKSSTVRMTAAILRRHGLRTGAYLSPHLVSFAERIRIEDEDLEPAEFAGAIQRAAHAAELVDRSLGPDDRVTQFELLTAAAYSELARQGVEVAVIEAGLGGRYDATNVIPSRVQVLTSVGLEHTRWLGPTITAIATEKLDVVQPGATLVLGYGLHPDAVAVAERVAGNRHPPARIVHAGADPGVPLTALGPYQRRNFALARTAAEAYLGELDPNAVATAAAEMLVPGRLQVIDEEPLTLLDGAHNPDGMRRAGRVAAPSRSPPAASRWSRSSRSSTTRTPRACWPR